MVALVLHAGHTRVCMLDLTVQVTTAAASRSCSPSHTRAAGRALLRLLRLLGGLFLECCPRCGERKGA